MLPLSDAARCWLLDLARRAVEAAAAGEAFCCPAPPSDLSSSDRDELARPHAAFVSLHKQGKLRGCVGRISRDMPLAYTVPEIAQAAAREDARFRPVALVEVPEIRVEISVLSAFFPVRPDQIIPGVHGLVVRQGVHRGILLPQVAAACRWDAARLLRETCRKAGLSADAWKGGVALEAFTAEIISEGH
jgi:AmmeMemoRadiSam system protein A